MAALVEGVEYGLSSLDTTSANKSVLQVKLTDSALKAIEEFAYYKDSSSGGGRKPSVQFDGTNGTIKIPVPGRDGDWQTYRLSTALIPLDPKGSFDCVQQYSGERLDLLGSMTHKVSIAANEDSYKNTRDRMALVEEQLKKQSAKEIKPSGPNIGKKVKVIKKPGSTPIPPPPPPASRHDRFSPIDTAVSKYSTPQQHSINSAHDQRSQHNTSASSRPPPGGGGPSLNTSASRPPPAGGGSAVNASSHHRSSPTLSTQNRPPGNPELMKKPLRDRMVHLLALKNYKKPEIMLKLKTDGLRDKDKNQIGVLLHQVGLFNSRDNSYCLQKGLYSEVQLSWVGYSEQDRHILKRRLALDVPQSNTPPPTSVSPAVSPVHSTGSQGSPTNSQTQKRPGDDHDHEMAAPNAKKQRVSHMNGSSGGSSWNPTAKSTSSRPNSPSVQPPTATGPSSKSSSKRSSNSHTSKDTNPPAPTSAKCDKKPESKKSSSSRRSSNSVQSSLNQKNEDEENNQENNNISKTDKSDQENYDFISDFTHISSMEERQKYKQRFNCEYEEYKLLHANIEKVTSIFQQLRKELYQEEEGSDNYEQIKERIVQEYKELKKDPNYSKNRKRCEYLHKKLAHIKSRILEFDNARYCCS